MAERIQLKDPGSEFVMAVSQVSSETVEGIDYFLFTNGHKELLVPVTSVRSQLERLGAEIPGDIKGKTVKFSRSTKLSKYGKAFWNLDLVSGAELSTGGESGGKPTAGTSASVSPSVDSPKKPTMREAYKSLTEWVIKEISPLYNNSEFGMPPEVIASCTATLFIQACKAGKVE